MSVMTPVTCTSRPSHAGGMAVAAKLAARQPVIPQASAAPHSSQPQRHAGRRHSSGPSSTAAVSHPA